jgi:GNAT superfamily N-acetyltransferase
MSAPLSPATGTTQAVVRVAQPADSPTVCAGVRALLSELGGGAAGLRSYEAAFHAILARPSESTLLLAQEEGERLVGLLGASWPLALRTGGRYGLIQELWVQPDRRGREIGRLLLEALAWHARRRGLGVLEVGLPSDRYEALAATRSFYERNGFVALGERMRLRLT